MNDLDAVLQAVTPTVMVPKFEPMVWLNSPGHRFLMADDGLWLEVWRPWLHLVWPLAKQPLVAMPYGSLSKKCEIAKGILPSQLINRFVEASQAKADVEQAAWVLWDEIAQQYRYQDLHILRAGKAHVQYERPVLEDHEHLAVDMHSHARFDAGFSSQDDKDDKGEVKFSFVVGNCHHATPTQALRLCALGLFLEVPLKMAACS